MRTSWVQRSLSAVVVTAALVAAVARVGLAQSSGATGSKTGDGSSPFTGLATAPEANLFVGSAVTTIPIEVPPGRKNLTPKVALTYNSGGGPSPYGYGWDLPLGKIQRSTKRGLLSCTNPGYDFVLSLPESTVACTITASTMTTGTCLTAAESSFLSIQYDRNSNEWEVWDKSGLHYVFGAIANDRTGSDTSALFVPGTQGCVAGAPDCPCGYTFSWALDQITDPNGNQIEINYYNSGGTLMPQSIGYGGNPSQGLADLFQVQFQYVVRTDLVSNGTGGFPATLYYVLSDIQVIDLVANRTIRSYSLSYGAGHPRQSLLQSVAMSDGNNNVLTRVDGAPAASIFQYHQNFFTTGNPGGFEFAPAAYKMAPLPLPPTSSPVSPPAGTGRVAYTANKHRGTLRELIDMNGDGIPDLVDATSCDPGTNPYWEVFFGSLKGLSTTAVQWALPQPFPTCDLDGQEIINNNGDTVTLTTLMDVNGDGIPDFVDARNYNSFVCDPPGATSNSYWCVYLGQPYTGGTGAFTASPVSWYSPNQYIRYMEGNVSASVTVNGKTVGQWDNGTSDILDLIDFNGDGLPDLVQSSSAPSFTIWLNTGQGFDPNSITFATQGITTLGYTTSGGTQEIGIYDINGDGLPDEIIGVSDQPGNWEVSLNTGYGLAGAVKWSAPDVCGRTGIRDAYSSSDKFSIARDFFDINGDGLPDLITACAGSNTWDVYLNQGDTFASNLFGWPANRDKVRNISNTDGSLNVTFQDVVDIDGDGLVDAVDFTGSPDSNHIAFKTNNNTGGAWCASNDGSTCSTMDAANIAPNPNGEKPDLLEQMENGIGGTTYIDYRPSTQWNNIDPTTHAPTLPFVIWTVSHLDRDDGLCAVGAQSCPVGSPPITTDLAYAFGRFSAAAREFRGFGEVAEIDATGTQKLTWFAQDAAHNGQVQQTAVTNGTHTFVRSFNAWQCVDNTPGSPTFGQIVSWPDNIEPGQSFWAQLGRTDRYDYNADAHAFKHSFSQNVSWDAYGNVTQTVKGGDGTTSVITQTSYVANASAYIVDRPQHLLVLDGTSNAPVEEKWFTYDKLNLGNVSKGNVTAVYSWLDQVPSAGLPAGGPCPAGTGKCVVVQTDYDNFGNAVSVTDANNNRTVTSYDSPRHLYPATVSNALNQQVTTTYDPGCGKLLSKTILYDPTVSGMLATTRDTYDSFCRLSTVRLPDEPDTGPAHLQYTYFLGAPAGTNLPAQPTDIYVSEIEPNNHLAGTNNRVRRDSLIDALGRTMQTQRDGVVDGTYVTLVEKTATYDNRGNVSVLFTPFSVAYNQNTSTPVPYVGVPNGNGEISFQYDPLNRKIQTTNPSTQISKVDYSVAWQVSTTDECYNAGTCPGSKTVDIKDAFGRVVEHQVYNGASFETGTVYTFDVLGRVKSSEQETAAGSPVATTLITTSYDSLSRKISMHDPDAGAVNWTYGYDLSGNLIYQDDPQGTQHIQFTYDVLNRPLSKLYYQDGDVYCPPAGCTPNQAPSAQILYTYDQQGGSRACPAAWCPAGVNCSFGVGHLTNVVDLSGNSASCFDIRGRQTQVVTNITANGSTLPGTMQYAYDVADHVSTITYPDGEVLTYGYDNVGQTVSMQGTANYLAAIYYDAFGRPDLIKHANGVTDNRLYWGPEQDFHLKQITTGTTTAYQNLNYPSYQANGLLTGINDTLNASGALSDTVSYTYDGLRRLTAVTNNTYANAAYVFGDHLGNLTAKDGTAYSYSGAGPHQVTNAIGGSVTYDVNGNRYSKANSSQTYVYDAENRIQLIAFAGGNASVGFEYDYTGRRTATLNYTGSSITGVTRYFSDVVEVTNGWLTKYYVAAGMRVASQRIVQPSTFAALPPDPAVQLAGDSNGHSLLLTVILRPDIGVAVAAFGSLGVLALFVVPGRRKAVVGIALRRGHVLLVVLAFGLASMPLPILIRPAWAGGGGGSPTPTPYGGAPSDGVKHFHLNHLGSTEVITNSDGTVYRYIRYKAYGEDRGEFTASGGLIGSSCGDDHYCREFTTYDTEPVSGLQYAGARFYDPVLAMYTTHDAAGQYANPYLYSGGNPVAGTDPTGTIFGIDDLIVAFIIGFAIGFAVTAVQAGINGASFGQAIKAGLISGAIGGATGVGLGVVGAAVGAVASPALSFAYNAALTAAGTYSAVQGFRSGQYLVGAVGIVSVAFGAYGAARAARGLYGASPAGSIASEPGEPISPVEANDLEATLDPKAGYGQITEEILPNEEQSVPASSLNPNPSPIPVANSGSPIPIISGQQGDFPKESWYQIGVAGNSSNVRVVTGGFEEAQAIFNQWTASGTPVTGSTYPGTLVRLPDGGVIGLRAFSDSGGPAIDINIPGVSTRRIHFE